MTLAPTHDDPALGADPRHNNDFTYVADPYGRQVPLGSHMRRMNPRDTTLSQLTDVNLHRIIRRGTTYGVPYDPNATSAQDDDVPRGIYFLLISAKAMATMEFLQQEWINNGNFMNLGDERDPNVGLQQHGAIFTIPEHPGQAPHPRHSNVQRAAWWGVLLHAVPVRLEMDRRPPLAQGCRRLSRVKAG